MRIESGNMGSGCVVSKMVNRSTPDEILDAVLNTEQAVNDLMLEHLNQLALQAPPGGGQ